MLQKVKQDDNRKREYDSASSNWLIRKELTENMTDEQRSETQEDRGQKTGKEFSDSHNTKFCKNCVNKNEEGEYD